MCYILRKACVVTLYVDSQRYIHVSSNLAKANCICSTDSVSNDSEKLDCYACTRTRLIVNWFNTEHLFCSLLKQTLFAPTLLEVYGKMRVLCRKHLRVET